MRFQHIRTTAAKFLALSSLSAVLCFSQTTATVVGGRLSVVTSAADQSAKVEVRGGTTRLFGFAGLPDGQTYVNLTGIAVQTGAGSDKIEFDIESPNSLDISANNGTGPAETSVKWKLQAGGMTPSANIAISGAPSGASKVNVEVDNESNSASIGIDAGTATEVAAKVNSSNTSSFLRTAFNAAAPKTSLEINSAASALELDIRAGALASNDELTYKVSQSRAATISANWNVDGGAGDDKIEASLSTSGSTVTHRGSFFGRGGNDFIKVETDGFATVTGLTINGGLGDDQLEQVVKGRFQMSQTLGTTMIGADGTDYLTLSTDTGIFGTGLPNDINPIINCGAGSDFFKAFGQIIGCEARF